MKQLSLEKIHIDENGLDMMTKIVPVGKYAICKEKANLVDYGPK